MSDHDRSVIVRIGCRSYLMDGVDNVVGPSIREAFSNDMVEEIH